MTFHRSHTTLQIIAAALGAWTIAVFWMYYFRGAGIPLCGPLMFCLDKWGIERIVVELLGRTRFSFAFIVLLLYGVLGILSRGRLPEIRISVFRVIGFGMLWGFVSLNLLMLAFAWTSRLAGLPTGISFLTMQGSILKMLLLTYAGWAVLLLVGYALGSLVLHRLKLFMEHTLSAVLVRIAMGFMIFVGIAFVILGFHALTGPIMYGIVGASLILGFKYLRSLFAHLRSTYLTGELHLLSLSGFGIVLMMVMFTYVLYDGIEPFPFYWDGHYRYFNTVQLLAESGRHLGGIFPYPTEILMSTGPLLMQSMMVSITMPTLFMLLAALAVYACARSFSSARISIAIVAVMITMPLTHIIIGNQTKFDYIGVFYGMLAVLLMLQSYRMRYIPYLLVSGLLVGFAVSTKLTGAFFAIGFFAASMIYLYQAHRAKWVTSVALLGISMAIPLIPWLGWNALHAHGPLTPQTLVTSPYEGPDLGVCAATDMSFYRPSALDERPVAFTGTHEELDRYTGYEERTFWWGLMLPLRITILPYVQVSSIVQLGPLFLCLLPLVAFGLRVPRKENEGSIGMFLGVSSLITWILWALYGSAIAWYGLLGIPLVLALIAYSWQRVHDTYLNRLVGIVVCISLIATIIPNGVVPHSLEKVHYLAGNVSHDDLLNLGTTGEQGMNNYQLAEYINDDATTATDPKYVYNLHYTFIYWIENNDRRLYNDYFADSLNCILATHQNSTTEVITYMKSLGFRYIATSPVLKGIDFSAERTLDRKVLRLEQFMQHALDQKLISPIGTPDEAWESVWGLFRIE